VKIVTGSTTRHLSSAMEAERAARAGGRFDLRDGTLDVPLLSGTDLLEFRATLSRWDGDKGGFLIPEGYSDAVEIALSLHSVVRRLARVERRDQISELGIVTCNDAGTEGTMLVEGQTLPEVDATFGLTTFRPVQFFSGRLAFPYRLVEDAIGVKGNLTQSTWLGTLLAQRLARRQNRAFSTGVFPGPLGLFTSAPVAVTTASPLAITGDEILALIEAHSAAYQEVDTCGFMGTQSTFLAIRKLKDAAGQYLFPQSGRQRAVAGFPYFVNPHAPEITTGSKCLLFGDYSQFVVCELGPAVTKTYHEAEGLADQDRVAIELYLRSDGGLLESGAHPVIALQTHS
jgi:HK97 family phage major capsid protein